MTIPLVVLWIGSVEGLLRGSERGYFFVYGLVPFATIFHGIVLVPGGTILLSLLDVAVRPWALAGMNLLVLAAAIFGQVRLAKAQSPALAT